jgi:hypothetical protein
MVDSTRPITPPPGSGVKIDPTPDSTEEDQRDSDNDDTVHTQPVRAKPVTGRQQPPWSATTGYSDKAEGVVRLNLSKVREMVIHTINSHNDPSEVFATAQLGDKKGAVVAQALKILIPRNQVYHLRAWVGKQVTEPKKLFRQNELTAILVATEELEQTEVAKLETTFSQTVRWEPQELWFKNIEIPVWAILLVLTALLILAIMLVL